MNYQLNEARLPKENTKSRPRALCQSNYGKASSKYYAARDRNKYTLHGPSSCRRVGRLFVQFTLRYRPHLLANQLETEPLPQEMIEKALGLGARFRLSAQAHAFGYSAIY